MNAQEALARALPIGWETGVDDHKLDDARYILSALPNDVVLISRDELAAALHVRRGHRDTHPDFRGCSNCSPEADAIFAAIKEGQK